MLYKIFLVEDEVVTREGIRDSVDWKSAGFEFCGEAPDGEIALPLIEASQPDVLMTDIKMPFMDGLQLCKIVRERMPEIRIIILSGHDEFNYAQAAVKIGVTEYLLKPLSAQDIHHVLQKVASLLDQERREKESLQQLRHQAEDNLALLRERFLLSLVMGGHSPPAALEQSQKLGLDIIARCYLVVLFKVELDNGGQPFDYNACQRVERLVTGLVENSPDAFLIRKGMEELVLMIKGDQPGQLVQEGHFLAELIQREVEGKTQCRLKVGVGSTEQRLGDIHHSFAQALAKVQEPRFPGPDSSASQATLLKLDKAALENYLRFGTADDFDSFFAAYVRPLDETTLQSYLVKNYIFVDIILTTAKFVGNLGGNIDQIIPEIHFVETLLMNIKTVDQIREESRKIFANALAYRDNRAGHQHALTIQQAKAYIDAHYIDPGLSLNEVAAQVNLSPSHFSTVFSHETGETFRDYLARLRIDRAKELLRTTSLKTFEVAYQSGYNDPHYFSYIFRKNTGFSPQQFRLQPQQKK